MLYMYELYDSLKQGAQVCASVWLQIRIANELRAATVEKLWEITEELNILYRDNWTALVDREMAKFQKELFLSGISKHCFTAELICAHLNLRAKLFMRRPAHQ